jgi:hypothetical protein
MEKIDDPKRAGHKGKYSMPSNVHLRRGAGVWKDVSKAQLPKCQLRIIGMGAKIF